MSERIFRLILGATLLVLLYLNLYTYVYIYIGLLIFEGLTNWRIPVLISRMRYGDDYPNKSSIISKGNIFSFNAERVLRIIVAIFLIVTFIIFPQQAWFFPWFIAFMLFMAGVTNICPMVMGLRWIGFK